jgi:hypothetical protein
VLGQDQVYLPTAGSVTFIQLFGSSLAPNPHLHMMFLDGVRELVAFELRDA